MCFALLPTKLSYYHYVLPILVDRSYFKCVNQYKSQTQTHQHTHARTQASARSLTRTHALTHAYKHTHKQTHIHTHVCLKLYITESILRAAGCLSMTGRWWKYVHLETHHVGVTS